jgi:ubiquitin-conjugating enzyme E2 S
MIELQGPQGTPYETKFFLLKLVFSQDFPSAPPRGFFLTKLYHPNVDVSTGAICVNTLKKDWAPETSLSHVAAVIRCLLIVPFPESSLNDEAGKLFMESYEEYAKRARLMADVHGRSFSVVAKEGEGKEETTKMPASPVTLCSSKSSEEQQRGILQSASGNSGHAAPAAASAASVTAVKKVGNKKMMSRKKSLKRL